MHHPSCPPYLCITRLHTGHELTCSGPRCLGLRCPQSPPLFQAVSLPTGNAFIDISDADRRLLVKIDLTGRPIHVVIAAYGPQINIVDGGPALRSQGSGVPLAPHLLSFGFESYGRARGPVRETIALSDRDVLSGNNKTPRLAHRRRLVILPSV